MRSDYHKLVLRLLATILLILWRAHAWGMRPVEYEEVRDLISEATRWSRSGEDDA